MQLFLKSRPYGAIEARLLLLLLLLREFSLIGAYFVEDILLNRPKQSLQTLYIFPLLYLVGICRSNVGV